MQDLTLTAKFILLLTAAYLLYSAISFISILRQRQWFRHTKGALPPFKLPQSERIIGWQLFKSDVKALKNHYYLQYGHERFERLGVNTYEGVYLGTPVLVTREPENLKTIQATDSKIWHIAERRHLGFRTLLGRGIFTTDGPEWAHSREMLRPNFVRSQVADLDMLERHTQALIRRIPRDGSTVDLGELFFLLTVDSATELLFGHSTNALESQSGDTFAESFTRAQLYIAYKSRYGNLVTRLFMHDPHWEHDRKFVHDFADSFVLKGLAKREQLLSEKSKGQAPDRYVFIDELVRQTSDPIEIRSELLNILLAGRDTTASLLSNTWFMLARRPNIVARLRIEVDALRGERPTFDQIKEMKYLRAVLNESLRLHPVVPLNVRVPTQDTTLPLGGGPDGKAPLFVRKGQMVRWSLYSMHRRKDYYGEDAEEFKPERWLDDPVTGRKGLRVSWEYLPFNGGPRICLGQQLALTEASFATIRLLQAFDKLDSRDPAPWSEGLSVTCTSLNGVQVALTARQ